MGSPRPDYADPPPEALRERALVAAALRMAAPSPSASVGAGGEASGTRDQRGADAGAEAIERLGVHLPGYRIEREIHRGGQGVVYLALQRSTRRRVAIKVMKEGPFASADDRARFEREVRLLARLDHPSIVAIHDSGTAGGCFYIVMNYIEGLPLDVWMRDGDRTLEETLRLFLGICEAVGAAHLRGVIHRDLKPSNIRVDARGRPHVLDFGLAKADEGSRGHGESIMPAMTLTGQFVGSLPWSSPEQASGDAGGIDVRSDVYSLGVVLYQMLTGTFPYDVGGSMLAVAERIAHAEPAPPSEAIAGVSRLGRLFGGQRGGSIDDDVETIVLKCLSKDRERRYQNAGELARDIGHYLAGEPIEAKRDSLAYVLGKQVKRHRLVVSFAALLGLVVLGGFVSSIVLWQRAEREALRATQKGTLAQQREAEARQIASFQQRMLRAVDPQRMGAQLRDDVLASVMAASAGAATSASGATAELQAILSHVNFTNLGIRSLDVNVLVPTLAAIDRDFAGQPLVQAGLLESVSLVYVQLEQFGAALTTRERALDLRRRLQGEDHPETLESLHQLGLLHGYRGVPAQGEPLARTALAKRRIALGEDHPDTLASMSALADLLIWQRKWSEADGYCREALEQRRQALGDDHPDTIESIAQLHGILWVQGKREESEAYAFEVLERRRRILGENHPQTLDSLNTVGVMLWHLGRMQEAEDLLVESRERKRRVQGDDHPDTLMAVNNIGLLRQAQGRFVEAEAIHREALAGYRRVLGDNHPFTIQRFSNVASAMAGQGRLIEAEELIAKVVASARAVEPVGWRLGTYLLLHAKTLVALEQFERAEAVLLDAQQVFAAALGEGHSYTSDLSAAFASLYDAWHPGKSADDPSAIAGPPG